ncbi:hypothetical protein FQN50_001387 [Emmonsiellopsis sp. PD_5]|nr:hypothetical protein FQN50_001387 [Emmonsiellopsis sp. PD_5]
MAAPPSPVKGAGLLLRLYDLQSSSDKGIPELSIPDAKVTTITSLTSNDDKSTQGFPSAASAYEVLHISKLIVDDPYAEDVAATKSFVKSLDWQVYGLINKVVRPGLEVEVVPKGATMVCVGITPSEGQYQDYSDWYDSEHIRLLSKVPGWRASARYQLAKAFGRDDGIAPFITVHFYDEANGLGGKEWQESVSTEWTKRIREGVQKPHFRRVWTVGEQRHVTE